MDTIYLPGLRGAFGDWIYYSCLMRMSEVAARVQYAREVHQNTRLSDMIQRELEDERAPAIASYLVSNEERFFNSIVVAVYRGEPSWHEFGRITPRRPDIDISDVPGYARDSLGFLRFTGAEKLFALDGQHRLAGIRKALNERPELGDDELSTIFVAHRDTQLGLRRTRRLFTTLNKTARPVSKSAVIALDESDVMAITVRRLVEEHPYFKDDRIVFKHTNNIATRDKTSLTTIGNLYDVLERIFLDNLRGRELGVRREKLRFFRPDDRELDDYYEQAVDFLGRMGTAFPELAEFYKSANPERVVAVQRSSLGGSMLFRPIGFIAMVQVIQALAEHYEKDEAFRLVAKLPRRLDKVPYIGVIWDPQKSKIIASGGPLLRRLLLYMVDPDAEVDLAKLRADYAKARGIEPHECPLPNRVV